MGTVKTAILLEWVRLFVPHGTRPPFWWMCRIVMWVNILYYISVIIVSTVSCSPHEKIWDPTLPGTCLNIKAFFVSNATLNLASDIIILALPQRSIWSLNMSRDKKIGVSLVFAVGVMYEPLHEFKHTSYLILMMLQTVPVWWEVHDSPEA